ncbi:hypothetical protein KGI31_14475 [Lactiplantibacillus pentosus]|uniref:Uncharacterized protein n=1 Tax=Lactiplantibacillus pentosus TaxID=1589 RepID=A0AAX6LGD6_LACPE|nr:hypothetical protein [Lactiplantibacillus pentosus]MBU7498105.1 hypothetical protein [Lactiplantibacillus pentosus]MDF2313641.1 hypothetical protein [Lactiplantibacillus pentosus]WNN85479.1 hypothetical protein RNT80_00700 [Lactiplantibacillus pentosus]
MKKKRVAVWGLLGIFVIIIGIACFFMVPGTTVRNSDVADKQVSKLNDSLYEYYSWRPEKFDLISSANDDEKIVILVSLKDSKYTKNSISNKIELTKINYALASLQRKNHISGRIQVVYEVDSTVIAESENLYRPVKFISPNDDTYDSL